MKNLIFIGNFLSQHGINPTYTETLVWRLKQTGAHVSTASDKKNIILNSLI